MIRICAKIEWFLDSETSDLSKKFIKNLWTTFGVKTKIRICHCPYLTMVKIPLKIYWIRVVIRITTKIKQFIAVHTSLASINVIKIRRRPFALSY